MQWLLHITTQYYYHLAFNDSETFTDFNPGIQPLTESGVALWPETKKPAKDFLCCDCCKAFNDLINCCTYTKTKTHQSQHNPETAAKDCLTTGYDLYYFTDHLVHTQHVIQVIELNS